MPDAAVVLDVAGMLFELLMSSYFLKKRKIIEILLQFDKKY